MADGGQSNSDKPLWHSRFARQDVVLTLLGVLGGATLGAGPSYYYGHNQGHTQGVARGAHDAQYVLIEERTNYVAETEQQVAFLKQAAADARAVERTNFEARLELLEAEFRAGMEALLLERYAEELANARIQGQNDGTLTGREEGVRTGRQECQRECVRALNEFRSYGKFWRAFTSLVYDVVETNPDRETELRSMAEAIVEIAMVGRDAAAGMSAQLYSTVDEIKLALRRGDMEQVRELLNRLANTLEAKGEAWQKHYQVIVGAT